MSELPKFVRARLAAQPVGNDHPDADLLSAFAENSLLDRERERVMAHLATCADCREVLALVAPAEGPPVSAVAQERRPWLTLALLRWAAIPATAAVVVGAVLLHTRSDRSAIVPKSTTAAETSQPAASPAQPQIASESPAAQAPGLQAKAEPRRAMPARTAVAERVAPKSMAKTSGRAAETAILAEAKPAAPAKEDTGQTFASGTSTAAGSDVDKLSADRTRSNTAVVALAPPPAPPSRAPALDAAPTELNRPAMASKAKKQAAMSGAMAAAPIRESMAPGVGGGVGGSYAVAGAPADLRISPEGKVERRLDANAPWQPMRIDDSVTFRAVARIGNDIWLGGNGGVLYHSGNAGATWQRMAAPTVEDITGIAFNNRREGTLTTAGGQRFTTHDAGATWAKARE